MEWIFTILITTAALWLIDLFIVLPLARFFAKKYHPKMSKDNVNGVPSWYYILADVLVLSVGGFLVGITTGWYFFGIAFRKEGWPGIIVLFVTSLIAANIFVAHHPDLFCAPDNFCQGQCYSTPVQLCQGQCYQLCSLGETFTCTATGGECTYGNGNYNLPLK